MTVQYMVGPNAVKRGVTNFAQHFLQGPYDAASFTRTTTNVTIGVTGSYLHKIVVVSPPTVADLTITDFAGVTVAVIKTTDTVGEVKEINVQTAGGGFVLPLHATGVGTITAIGMFS